MDGVLVVDKPAGKTSHDVVAVVRKAAEIKKVGHTGTLDPMATGVLVLTIGKATRIGRFLELEPKEYIAEALFGISTNTQDVTGEVLRQSDMRVDEAQLKAALPKFTGEISQIPPMVSAIKVGGKPLYKLARQGKEVERAARDITVYELELLDFFEKDGRMRAKLRVLCSGGTYVRTLVSDLGDTLGVGAALASLRRTRVGRYSLSDARGLEELRDRESIDHRIIDMAKALDHLAAVIAKDGAIGLILNGREINRDHISEGSEAASGFVRLISPAGELLAIGLAKADTEVRIKPEIVFG